ncbi:sodium-dependent transporter [Anaerotignum lactatifermentans]|uniref:Transporter n=1 Tax=Anaerotignum lactatifermentans TaxID=160404 RepID=A0ABS2GC38_9FIRM|nr:sodium-dependent transporter [Anaerotignum lactatifermentans]MBM6830266.1 sodium-dependent transporter [Anaerotignum lactatifermentans]MBM6878358.1 sodium-dependent transporter [Anaerotignum lactatifermentans]MBM6951513.1 sodium-dependent transporter [Anaerotignum lactatifermentans]
MSNNSNESRGFGTRIGYILSMAGFCIGIGNLWKFPYMVGANGGGAFLICYLIIALCVGVPLFLIEVQIGRSSQLSGIAGMRRLTGKKGSGWNAIGWIALFTVTIICFYLITIIGWNLGYIVKVATGSLSGMDGAAIAQEFTDFSGSWSCVGYTVIVVVLGWILMNTGVKTGVEKVCTFAMPLLIVMLIGLAIYANTLPGSREGLMWYITPDFSKINVSVFQAAAVQVFYSIGVGMCCGIVYGSYINKKADMVGDTASVGEYPKVCVNLQTDVR